VMKDIAPDVLVGTIRGVAEGQTVLDPVIAQRVIDRGADRMAAPPELLSPREMDVLGLMAEGLTNRQIATRLWISEATVKSHVSHILAKLGRTDRTQAIVFAMRAGLVRPPLSDGADQRRTETGSPRVSGSSSRGSGRIRRARACGRRRAGSPTCTRRSSRGSGPTRARM
jgi:DNA-binding CsgD family transcriptional regulator